MLSDSTISVERISPGGGLYELPPLQSFQGLTLYQAIQGQYREDRQTTDLTNFGIPEYSCPCR